MSEVIVNGVHYVPINSSIWNRAYEPEGGYHTPPDDDRQVLVFLNGFVPLGDTKGRCGGGWGIQMGWFDHDKRFWRVHGQRESFVTHWVDLPQPPALPTEKTKS